MSDAPAGALLALWNDVTPELDADYNDWHANEHVPERLTVAGMLWGRRYVALPGTGGPRYLTLYGLRDAAVLDNDAYRRLLSEPTPMSARMRPQLRNVSRWVCRLDRCDPVGAEAHLAVLALDQEVVSGAAVDRFAASVGSAALLVGERLHDAAPLPWVQPSQGQGIDGRWLLCAASERQAPTDESARWYAPLPVRRD